MNIIAKGRPGAEYILTDLIATRLSKSKFEQIQAQNEILKDYRYIPQNQTDFSWWPRISKKLTNKKIVQAYFECDFYGNITEY